MRMKKNRVISVYISVLVVLVTFVMCSPEAENLTVSNKFGSLPRSVKEPYNNLASLEKVELGRLLFWDPILSGNKDVACVTCHHPNHGYAEQLDLSLGVGAKGLSENRKGGVLVLRNAPTVLNTAFNGIDAHGFYDPLNTFMFWDNRMKSLEQQALGPIHSAEEMRGEAYLREDVIDSVTARLRKIPEYVNRFKIVFGDELINGDRMAKAIAAFERSLIANNSRFDQYARGDENALSVIEVRGMNEFIKAKCNVCHSGPMFSDFELHNLSVPHNSKLQLPDLGVGGKFRTPTLRNLSFTGPYMHNGVFSTLEETVKFYNEVDKSKDEKLSQLNFNNNEDNVKAIVAFIKSLNDPNFDKTIPETVPSGLPPGGNIK